MWLNLWIFFGLTHTLVVSNYFGIMKRSTRSATLGVFLTLPKRSLPFHCHFYPYSRNISIQSTRFFSKHTESNPEDSRWRQDPFDFSSRQGWEHFYQTGLSDGSYDHTSVLEYEWHAHISHSEILKSITPSIEMAMRHSISNRRDVPSILIIGCGNSSLPRVLHDAFASKVRITCLDYSKVCIDMIQEMYSDSYCNMDFVVGDAMKLNEVIEEHYRNIKSENRAEVSPYDVVIDKGLMDALMCGEGFDVDVLQRSVNQVLTPNEWGMHVLICFPLANGTKERLVQLGQQSEEQNLYWRFDLPIEGSENGRASFNIGKRNLWKLEPSVETLQTKWN